VSGLLGPPTPQRPTQRSPGASALMLLNATVQELIAIDCDCFNLLEAYISTVESPCTVDSTLSNLRLLPWLDIDIVSTLPHFPRTVLWVVSTSRVVYLGGYHTLFDLFRVPPHIPTYDIRPPREDAVRLCHPLVRPGTRVCLCRFLVPNVFCISWRRLPESAALESEAGFQP
jgi:hypothetical protein